MVVMKNDDLFVKVLSFTRSLMTCRYEHQLENFCKFMDPLLDSPTPETLQGVSSFNDRMKNRLHKSNFWAHCLQQALSLGQKDMV